MINDITSTVRLTRREELSSMFPARVRGPTSYGTKYDVGRVMLELGSRIECNDSSHTFECCL